MNRHELEEGLANFYGGDPIYFNQMYPRMNYSAGVRFFCENAGGGAYWFLDIVGTEIYPIHVKGEEFLHVKLVVGAPRLPRRGCEITADDGGIAERAPRVLYKRIIDYTDCPEGVWSFYIENGLFCLPAER